jgi:DNA topoisomerase-1
MILVIVESGTKAAVIEKYLKDSKKLSNIKNEFGQFKVIASKGHVRDLAKKDMGINTKDFNCNFELIQDKKSTIDLLKSNINKSKLILLAADHDREGEGIAWHIQQMFNLQPTKYKRILFNEITQPALEDAVMNRSDINLPMVHSYLSRRILDRLVGFMITKLLWKAFDSNVILTAGRVQSATLNIIVNKENEIAAFESTPYWTIRGEFGKEISDTTLYFKDTIYKSPSNKDIITKLNTLVDSTFTMDAVNLKTVKEKAPYPFTTSSLQQTAYSSLHLPIKKTMSCAQELYEMGAITYMRTDSTTINPMFSKSATDYVNQKYGGSYVQTKSRKTKTSKNAQEAHEAIRPTNITKTYKFKNPEQEKLYQLIWNRTIAFFMADAIYEEVHVVIKMNIMSPEYAFIGKEKYLQFNGWLLLYNKENSNVDSAAIVKKYTSLTPRPTKFEGHNIWTNPPSRYNESSIIDKLEKSGIGRPSTYASIMSKLFEKKYIEKRDIQGIEKEHIDYEVKVKSKKVKPIKHTKMVGDEKSKLKPTEIGMVVDSFVAKNFKNIVDIDFTSSMENALDDIASKSIEYKAFLMRFYKQFEKDFMDVQNTIKTSDKSKNPKQQLGKEEHILYKPSDCMIIKRLTKYGPVIETRFHDTSKKSTYINIQKYLDDTNKDLLTVTKKDAEFLLSLPLDIVHNGNTPYKLLYGRYGFYLKNMKDNTTVSVFKRYVPFVLDMKIKELFEHTVNKVHK